MNNSNSSEQKGKAMSKEKELNENVLDERSALLKKLCAYSFAAYDWNLYLDTHPCDSDAIKMFRKMADRADELKSEFQAKYGPLTASAAEKADVWEWINSPWPWENV